jgi:hypothetical protein
VHKGNGVTGSLLYLENVAPFGRGERGCSHVCVTKDRPGDPRRHGRAGRTPGRTYMGSRRRRHPHAGPTLDLAFLERPDEPQRAAAVARDQADDDKVLSVVGEIAGSRVQPRQWDKSRSWLSADEHGTEAAP